MEDLQEKSDESHPFLDLVNIFDVEDLGVDAKADPAAATINPNYNDIRRLFQKRLSEFSWNPEMPYEKQPNMLAQHCPEPLQFPDHFYELGSLET